MAENKIVTLEVNSNLGETTANVLNLKQQLKEAKKEVLAMSEEFGVTSEQAIKAASKAGELGHQISEANKLVKSFNPSNSLQSTTSALGGVKEGFEVVGNTMKVVGVQSEGLESAITKVGIAMELSQGISAIQESATAFKTFAAFVQSFTLIQKISTAAQWLWNVAMAANPLGAIVLAITAVIAAGYKLISFFIESSAANEKAMAATKKNTNELREHEKQVKKSSDALKENNDKQYALAKASGASSEELRKLALKHADETISLNKKNTMLARSTFLRERDTLAALKANDASDEVIAAQDKLVKATYESFDKQRQDLTDSYKDKRKVITDNEVQIAQEATDRRKKAIEDAKESRKEAYDADKSALDEKLKQEGLSFQQRRDLVKADLILNAKDRKKLNDDINKEELKSIADHKKAIKDLIQGYDDRAADALAKDEQDKLDLKMERQIKADLLLAKNEKEQKLITDKWNEEYDRLQEEVSTKRKQDKYAKKAQDDLDIANNEQLSFEARLQGITAREALEKDIIFKSQKEKTDFEKQNADARKAIAKEETNAKIAQAERGAALLDNISGLLGKQTAAGKAAAVAATVINTYASAQKAFMNAQENPISIIGPAYPYIQAGLAVVAGLKNVQSILAVPTPGGGGGGSAPGGGAASAPSAPSFNVVGNGGANQIAGVMANKEMPPIKTYVVAGDVTTQQGLNMNIKNNATIG